MRRVVRSSNLSLLTVAQESFRIEPARILLALFPPSKVRL